MTDLLILFSAILTCWAVYSALIMVIERLYIHGFAFITVAVIMFLITLYVVQLKSLPPIHQTAIIGMDSDW